MNKIKKIIIPILIIAMFFVCIPKTENAANTTLKLGDISGDEVIDSRDTIKILEHIAASTIPKIKQKHSDWILTGEKLKVADINEDGLVDSRDTIKILEYIAASTVPTIEKKHPEWKSSIESKWIIEETGINLNRTDITIGKGSVSRLIATVTPTNATNKVITWNSSNPKVASVDGLGNVEGKSIGNAIITAKTKNGKTATCIIRVNIPVKSISLNKSNLTISKGDKYKFTLTINPSNATDKTVTWNSSNKNIVEVSTNGEIKAKSKGTAYIKVTSINGISYQCKVIVEDNKKAEKVIAVMREWKNMSGSKVHEQVYKYYNSTKPKYKMKWDSQWCSETVSAAFVKAGMVDLIGGVASHVGSSKKDTQSYYKNFYDMGIKKDKKVTPKPGWIVCYGSGTGHTALVIGTSGSTIKILAGGNSGSHGVHEKSISKSSVKFYGAPKFSS